MSVGGFSQYLCAKIKQPFAKRVCSAKAVLLFGLFYRIYVSGAICGGNEESADYIASLSLKSFGFFEMSTVYLI